MQPHQGTYKASPPWREGDDIARGNQLSEWLRVPWTKTWRLTYDGTASSTSYVNMPLPTATMTFKKLRDDTRLVFHVAGAFYATTGGAYCYLAIGLNGTDTAVAAMYANQTGIHIPIVGMVDIDDVPRGTYTFTLKWAYGVYTVNVNGADFFGVQVTETNRSPSL